MSPLSGKAKVLFAEFLGEGLTGSQIHRVALRSGIPEDEFPRLGIGNKVDHVLAILRVVERLFEGAEELGMYGQMMRNAVNVYGAAEQAKSKCDYAAGALAREGVRLSLDQPGATLAEVAHEEADKAGLSRTAEFALKAVRRFSSDPAGAVTAATTYAESACRDALNAVGIAGGDRLQLPDLVLRLRRETNYEAICGNERVAQAIGSLVVATYQLAHDVGDRHPGNDEPQNTQVQWNQVGAAMLLGHGVVEALKGRLLEKKQLH